MGFSGSFCDPLFALRLLEIPDVDNLFLTLCLPNVCFNLVRLDMLVMCVFRYYVQDETYKFP